MGGSTVGDHLGGGVLVGVRGCAPWVASPFPVAVVALSVLAAVAAVWAVRQLAVAAAAASFSAGGGVLFGWPARCSWPRWPRW